MAFKRSGVRISLPPPAQPDRFTIGLFVAGEPMRAVIQRVLSADVAIQGACHARIGPGLLVLVGVELGDEDADALWLAGKIVRLRIFADAAGLMNRSVADLGGEVLVVSQFTLLASTGSGNRPAFTRAARPADAEVGYHAVVAAISTGLGRTVMTGIFGADMQVSSINDGPVTILMDSRHRD